MPRALHVLVLLVPLAACGDGHAPVPPEDQVAAEPLVRQGTQLVVPDGSPLRSRLRIAALEARDVRRAIEAPARVEADPARIARITPPLPGRVVQLLVRFGDPVTVNQPLLTMDSPELVSAQTDLLNARSRLAQAARDQARMEDLARQGIAPRADLEEAQTNHDIARADVERSVQRLRLLGMNAAQVGRALTLRAPIAGRVVEYHVAAGEFHSDLSQSLMTIADLSQVWIVVDVPEKDIARVHQGMHASAELAAYPGEQFAGEVLFVGELLDPETRSLPVRIRFENPDGRLHPGMFGRVTFEETARPEIIVPQSAIVLMGDASYVFVETAPWSFERRRVVPGDPVQNETTITDGLRAGERIVIANAVLLQ
ncbi:MAG: efflux RND transporter periplasmic adaptor subunit [Kofleriaceae bacterium]|nr:efflux RND transporter periplasmic adaptor subunit [Kofleriaceae bacterium]